MIIARVAAVLCLLLSPSALLAQTGGGFDLKWNTADCGGATGSTVSGGSFLLEGTAGQSDAGFQSGGAFTLFGGFWGGGYPVTVSVPGPGPATPQPLAFRVHPARPNPFQADLQLTIDLPSDTPIRVEIYGARGDRIRTLAQQVAPAGRHVFAWDGRAANGSLVRGGIYFLRVDAGAHRVQQKISYLR